jgi:Guanylate kinase
VFILPPDLKILAQRLRSRATDSAEVIELRLRKAIEELAHYAEYEHLIVNDDLERAYPVLRAIYLTRRLPRGPVRSTPSSEPLSLEGRYDLGQLERLVQQNRESGADVHAQRLATGVDRPD